MRTDPYQGEAIVKTLGLDQGATGPYTIELFAGSLAETNCWWYFDTAMEVLQPYFDSGVLVCKSGQMTKEECEDIDWNEQLLQTRLESILTANYNDEPLDIILSPCDYISERVIPVCQNFGYGTESAPMPVLTGNNGDLSALRQMARGNMTMTIYKDRYVLANCCLDIINACIEGKEPAGLVDYTPDKFTFKTLFGEMTVVYDDEIDEKIINTGVYTRDEIYGD